MAKVIIQYPYALKTEVKKAMIDRLQKDWENGLLIVDGCAKITIHKDEDVIAVNTDEILEKELEARDCGTCTHCNTDMDEYPCNSCDGHTHYEKGELHENS